MKLIDIINKHEDDDEITVWDNTYDMEVYFYKNDNQDDWDKAMNKIASVLEVVEERRDGVVVDLYSLIDERLLDLIDAGLFLACDIDSIMESMDTILAGNVSERWMNLFADVLAKGWIKP